MPHDTNDAPTLELDPLLRDATQFAYSLTRNRSDAEDLAHTAWMRLHRKYGRIESRGIFFTSIRNAHYDQLRRTQVVSFFPLENAPEPAATDSPGISLDLETALSRLSQPERQSIRLNAIEGYTAKEIGQQLGMPRGTVLCHIARARRKLRKALGSEFGYNETAIA